MLFPVRNKCYIIQEYKRMSEWNTQDILKCMNINKLYILIYIQIFVNRTKEMESVWRFVLYALNIIIDVHIFKFSINEQTFAI